MELIISVGLLTAAIMIADVFLAFRGDWIAIVRLTLGAASYIAVLGIALKATGRFGAPPARLPLWIFLAAGAVGGLASALAKPQFDWVTVAASVTVAPVFLAGFHWFSLRSWGRVQRRRVAPGPRVENGK